VAAPHERRGTGEPMIGLESCREPLPVPGVRILVDRRCPSRRSPLDKRMPVLALLTALSRRYGDGQAKFAGFATLWKLSLRTAHLSLHYAMLSWSN
jgi:hypothetical protein